MRIPALTAFLAMTALTVVPGPAVPSAEDVPQPPGSYPAAPITADVADLAWMSGAWSGSGLGGSVEEHWTAPAGGSMLGMFRLVSSENKATVFALLLIEQHGEHVVYHFRHFGPGHKPWEPLDRPLVLDLVRLKDKEAVFESSVQSKPRRLAFRRDGDRLFIRAQSERDGRLEDDLMLELRRIRPGDSTTERRDRGA